MKSDHRRYRRTPPEYHSTVICGLRGIVATYEFAGLESKVLNYQMKIVASVRSLRVERDSLTSSAPMSGDASSHLRQSNGGLCDCYVREMFISISCTRGNSTKHQHLIEITTNTRSARSCSSCLSIMIRVSRHRRLE